MPEQKRVLAEPRSDLLKGWEALAKNCRTAGRFILRL